MLGVRIRVLLVVVLQPFHVYSFQTHELESIEKRNSQSQRHSREMNIKIVKSRRPKAKELALLLYSISRRNRLSDYGLGTRTWGQTSLIPTVTPCFLKTVYSTSKKKVIRHTPF